jgi:hypothetical protein
MTTKTALIAISLAFSTPFQAFAAFNFADDPVSFMCPINYWYMSEVPAPAVSEVAATVPTSTPATATPAEAKQDKDKKPEKQEKDEEGEAPTAKGKSGDRTWSF